MKKNCNMINTEKKKKIMAMIPQGGYWKDLPDKLQREYMGASYFLGGGKTGMARRLSNDEPSLTLTCNPAQKQTERCHPVETRPLQVREYARIQSFPDTWKFCGSTASQYKQIGNAVPVAVATQLGLHFLKLLGKHKSNNNSTSTANNNSHNNRIHNKCRFVIFHATDSRKH